MRNSTAASILESEYTRPTSNKVLSDSQVTDMMIFTLKNSDQSLKNTLQEITSDESYFLVSLIIISFNTRMRRVGARLLSFLRSCSLDHWF